ncbi:ArnT family glycosyltransferase [Propylenella binzhouense]|uniref:Glycosyltransferase RgtA/B/C/D-like domain-containing protein n=1 Tax=Propylenella binzhouense TaxID=2555902 RepID=A0A964WVQ2_9HYPH|nr:glycosyltransferase family 39 protein [Propylenella binzhouense]MYZ50060.1 hypothetical protein [Propylenella binzhouense]
MWGTFVDHARRNPVGTTLVLALAYALVFAALRLAFSDSIATDDSQENVFAQVWSLGYQARQPPLYVWLLKLVQSVLGPGIEGFVLVRYLLMVAFAGLAAAVARRVVRDPAWAVASAASYAAIYQIGWMQHQMFTHTAMLMVTLTAGMLAFMRYVEAPSLGRALVLGAAIGLGGLSKHSYWIFPVLLCLVALRRPAIRHRLDWRHLVLAAFVAALLYSPYALWLVQAKGSVAAEAQATVRHLAGFGDRVVRGLPSVAGAVLGFLFPLLLLVAAIVPQSLDPRRRSPVPPPGRPDWLRLLGDLAAAGLVVLVAALLLFGVATFKERHMHALFLLAPLWLMGRAGALGSSRQRTILVAAFGVVAAAAALVRTATFLYPDRPFCTPVCRETKPYRELGPALAGAGYGAATLVATENDLAGNLRALLPGARVVSTALPIETLPPASPGAACVLVWESAPEPVPPPPDVAARAIPGAPEGEVSIPWRSPLRADGWRMSVYRFRPLEPSAPACIPGRS